MTLVLTAGYQDADARSAAYEAQNRTTWKGLLGGRSHCQGCGRPACAGGQRIWHRLRADILAADSMDQDTGFADTRAYEWLAAYAAEYGFILR